MKRQRGQTMVEFALIAPMIFLMIFGMIWGGFMFMEYLRFSNDLRAAARDIALTDADKRETLEQYYKADLYNTYKQHLPELYEPTINVTHDTNDAIITVTFTRRNDLPNVLMWINFPPDKIPMLEYRMKLEDTTGSGSSNSSSNSDGNSSGNSGDNSDSNSSGEVH